MSVNYTLNDIAQITGGQCQRKCDETVEFLLYDSRRVVPSGKSVFFALQGRRDGHLFLREMADKGVRNFVVSRLPGDRPQGNYVLVIDTLQALQDLAAYHRSRFDIPVIGITGSNGKTIVKDWLSHFLSQFYNVVRSPKSFNSQVGVPLSVWQMSGEHQIAVFEAGISQPGEMPRLERIIRPTIGIFTILGDAHQENFSSLEQKLDEKLELFRRVETIFCNTRQPWVYRRIKDRFPGRRVVCWGEEEFCNLRVKNIRKTGGQTLIQTRYNGEDIDIRIGFTDKASIDNALTVLMVLLELLGAERVKQLDFTTLPQIEMRLQQIRGIAGTTIINDSYNCDLTSFQIALDYLVQQAGSRRKTVILSDLEQVSVVNGSENGQSPE